MEINIEKKHFYGILGLIILITSGIIIYANVDTSKPWHDASSIQVTINGQQMSLQEALENDLFTAQSEGGIAQETDPIWTSDKPNYATQTWVNNQNYATKTYVDSIANCPDGFKQYYDSNGNKFCMRPNTDTIHKSDSYLNRYNFYARVVDGKFQIKGIFSGNRNYQCAITKSNGFSSTYGTNCKIGNAQWFTLKNLNTTFIAFPDYTSWTLFVTNTGITIKGENDDSIICSYKWILDGKNVNLYPTQDTRLHP